MKKSTCEIGMTRWRNMAHMLKTYNQCQAALRLAQQAMHWHGWHAFQDKRSLEARAVDAVDAITEGTPAK